MGTVWGGGGVEGGLSDLLAFMGVEAIKKMRSVLQERT